jgi:hypothetical protein
MSGVTSSRRTVFPALANVLSRLALAAVVLVGTPATAAPPAMPSAEWLVEQVKTLAAPDMEGRASGTPGAKRAALHIAAEMQRAGLRPGGDDGTWEQAFTVPTGIRLGNGNALNVVTPAPRALVLGREFVPLTVSADGTLESDVVFAGFGITAPDVGWDDYAGLDVRGRVVLVIEGEPRRADPGGPTPTTTSSAATRSSTRASTVPPPCSWCQRLVALTRYPR